MQFILITWFLFFLFSCSPKDKEAVRAEWQGRIKYEDGVKVVWNPSHPVYGKIFLDLEEELSIGNEWDKNCMFYRVMDVATDRQRNIYILDSGNHRIQKFNANGQYLQTIGRKGQGPGEFEKPGSFFLDDDEDIYVLDGRKMKIFNCQGNFIKSIPLEISIKDFSVTSEEDLLARISPSTERKEAIVKIDKKGKIIKYLANFPDVKPAIRKGSRSGSYTIFVAFHSYTPHICYSIIDRQNFAYGFPLKYEINITDYSGNLRMKIKKKEEPQSIKQIEKNKIIKELEKNISRGGRKWPEGVLEEACEFPEYRPFFRWICLDDKQRLIVWRVKSVLDEEESYEFDLYSRDGYYLYRVVIPVLPEIIQRGFVFDIMEDKETGEVRVRRFKVKNWDQIKEDISS